MRDRPYDQPCRASARRDSMPSPSSFSTNLAARDVASPGPAARSRSPSRRNHRVTARATGGLEMTERRLASEYVRRPSPRPRTEPTEYEITWAWETYEQHIPSRVLHRQCIAAGCGEWPCRPYREASAILQLASLLAGQPPASQD